MNQFEKQDNNIQEKLFPVDYSYFQFESTV